MEKQEKLVNHLINRKYNQCHCNDNNKSYKIIENYRSILDRKQQVICSWKILNKNGKINFTRGSQFRKSTDALVIRSKDICLINPWYKYIDVNKHLLSILEQNQCYKVLEIVLLECNCSASSQEYELAIIECPCLEQLRTYCTYCRLTLAVTEQSDMLLPTEILNNVGQQTNISYPLDLFNDEINIDSSFHSRSGSNRHQCTVQIQVKLEQALHDINSDETNLLNTRKFTNGQQQSPIVQTFVEDVGSSRSETKPITLLQNDPIQRSSEPNIQDHAPNSSISLHSLSQQYFSKSISTVPRLKVSLHSQDTIESNDYVLFDESKFETLKKYITRGTQTKLYAILLPPSPLSEMKKAKIEARTSTNVTRTCQVNTLLYLIKTNESQIQVQYPTEDISAIQQIDHSSTTSFICNETQLIKELLAQEKVNVPTIEFEEGELPPDDYGEKNIHLSSISTSTNEKSLTIKEEQEECILTSPPLPCVNACDNIDLDESQLMLSNNSNDSFHAHIIEYSNNNNNSEQLISIKTDRSITAFDHRSSNNCQFSKLFRLKTNHYQLTYRKRRRNGNKKRACGFIQRLRRRRKRNRTQLFSSESLYPSCSSSFIIAVDDNNQFENHLLPTQANVIKHEASSHQTRVTSSKQRQQSIIDLRLNNSHSNYQYKAHDHTLIARASKTSKACEQLRTLLNNNNTPLEQLIHSQLILTCNDNYRSVCILIDDDKKSEQYRSSFLHYIYTTLSNTLKEIFNDKLIQLTCMNLVFFNNSLCDIINKQRLRLIDTGKRILLLPSCETSIRTSDDINTVINHLSTEMPFTHQIFIVNCYRKRSSVSGSFLFLKLAPISSIRPTGLLTNLNSATYSVLNLIRQLRNGRLFNANIEKRYLCNDCLLNRLLKNYLFSRQQTMTILSVKPKV